MGGGRVRIMSTNGQAVLLWSGVTSKEWVYRGRGLRTIVLGWNGIIVRHSNGYDHLLFATLSRQSCVRLLPPLLASIGADVAQVECRGCENGGTRWRMRRPGCVNECFPSRNNSVPHKYEDPDKEYSPEQASNAGPPCSRRGCRRRCRRRRTC